MRKRFYWNLPTGELSLGEAARVAAMIPLSNDPAPDGQRYLDADRAYARALQQEEAGAALIELCPETLRAGQPLTGEEEQLHRVVPVLKRLKGQTAAPVIVRTSRALVAERAIEHGAAAIHDPSGLTADTTLAKTVATTKAGIILGHMRGEPGNWAKLPPIPDTAQAIARDLRAGLHRASLVHFERNRLLVDPGLGLGKRREDNAAILAGLSILTQIEAPLAIHAEPDLITNHSCDLEATIVTAVLAGVYLIGTFDAGLALPLIASAEAIAAARPAAEPEPVGVSRRRGPGHS